MIIQEGMIVKSIAGHDKDRFYLVVKISQDRAFIADGKRRSIDSQKPKNLKHLRPTKVIVKVEDYKTDKSLRALLHSYNYSTKK